MVQSSLTAWLKAPAIASQSSRIEGHEQKRPQDVPTPPSSSDEKDGPGESIKVLPVIQQSCTQPGSLRASRPTLPPNVHFRACTREDLPALKRLNSLLLPIPYPESFYREILEDSLTNNITLLANWHDDSCTIGQEKGRLIGAIRCRLFAHSVQDPALHSSAPDEKPMLYLSTLVLLSPYRSYGVAAEMLRLLIVRAIGQYGIGSVGAHVWQANTEGLEWYAKRGFRVVGREDGYYRRLKPSGVVVVRREVGVSDLLGG
ncbi:hypothetical protein B0A54_15964 [Friedmanniomyces endolithicus]|uniref:N-acetyltransferase domain-containing protein n=1 Tax=Friedmanniomyces endolithicus TaxID=329885 RepID=A0A4U0U3T7_9PEZI|nr:hypothetical protein B0A54_15964 [Friedmanniomyces endolithicus]